MGSAELILFSSLNRSSFLPMLEERPTK
jgi:hypothetical protein